MSRMVWHVANTIQFLFVLWCGVIGEVSNNKLSYRTASTARVSSMILNLEVSYKLDVNLTDLNHMTAIQPDSSFDDKFYYSQNKRIYSKKKIHQKSRRILTTDEEIESFQQIGNETFLVHEKNAVKVYSSKDNKTINLPESFCNNQPYQTSLNCSHLKSIHFGPTSVDSTNNLVYYTAASKIYQVNLSENFSTTPFQLMSSFGSINAMALNNNFAGAFTIQESTNITVSHVDFLRSEITSVSLNGNPGTILQAVSIGKKALLCVTAAGMLLVNTDTGDYTTVAEGVTSLPCNHTECNQKQMFIPVLADYRTRGSDLYAIEKSQGQILTLKYNVSVFYNDDDTMVYNNISNSTAPKNDPTDTGVIVGSTVGAVILCLSGIALTVFCLRARNMKRRTLNKTTQRRHRNPSHSVNAFEEVELSSYNRDAEAEGVTGIEESRAETSEERSDSNRILKDRPLPPLPQFRESTVRVHPAQSGASESDDYCYADVRQYYKEGSIVKSSAVKDERPPVASRRPRPRLSLPRFDQQINRPYPYCDNPQTTPPRPRPRLSLQTIRQRNMQNEDTSPYCDNPSFLPVSEASEYDCKLSVTQQNEPYYVEVLGHSHQSSKTPVLVHGKPANKLTHPTPQLTLPISNHPEEQMETQYVLCDNQSCITESGVLEYAHDVYVTNQRKALAQKETLDIVAKEESETKQASHLHGNIFVTVISDKMELKLHTNYDRQTSTVTVLAKDP